MKLHSTVVLGLVAYVAAISIRHQSGPVEPDTDPDCSYYNTVFSASDNCAYLEDFWGVSHAEFVSWNPSVKSDCSGIKIGNSYCVEVTRKPKPTSSKPTSTSSPTPTKSPKPSPTQDGLTDNCTSFYFAVKDDNCQKIVKKYGTFTVTEFISWFLTWNPEVGGGSCGGLWAEVYVCVSIIGHTPTKPASTTTKKSTATPTPTGCTVAHPEPTQPGSIYKCKKWYLPAANEFCADIQKKFNITAAQFNVWNPSIGTSCGGLWKDVSG